MNSTHVQAQLEGLAHAVEALAHPAPAAAPWRLGGFLGGLLAGAALLFAVWWRWSVSLRRASQRARQRAAVRELSSADPQQLRTLLGGSLPAWTLTPDVERVRW